jgi:hypothetical protein
MMWGRHGPDQPPRRPLAGPGRNCAGAHPGPSMARQVAGTRPDRPIHKGSPSHIYAFSDNNNSKLLSCLDNLHVIHHREAFRFSKGFDMTSQRRASLVGDAAKRATHPEPHRRGGHPKSNEEATSGPIGPGDRRGARESICVEANFDPFDIELHPVGCDGCTEWPRWRAVSVLEERETRIKVVPASRAVGLRGRHQGS